MSLQVIVTRKQCTMVTIDEGVLEDLMDMTLRDYLSYERDWEEEDEEIEVVG